jgi:hypothetical protein
MLVRTGYLLLAPVPIWPLEVAEALLPAARNALAEPAKDLENSLSDHSVTRR